jgi:transcriptional regulator with XRE-family HTH domain
MAESFGVRLRRRREQQRIALSTIAEQTKIKASLLEGLERDDVSHWPVGIFRRAFIRAYANAIGLEPETVLQEFMALHPDPTEVVPAASTDVSVDGAKQPARPPTRLRFLVGSALESMSRGRDGAVSRPGSVSSDPAATEPFVVPAAAEPDFLAAASLCTAISRVDQRSALAPLLAEAVRILDAVGLVIWVWDSQVAELKPVLAHGYSETVLAKLPTVKRSADNATAAAFRSAETCVVGGSDNASGAIVAPLMTPSGCGGVLALEVPNGREQTAAVRALAAIFAAQLARWIRVERQAEVPDRRLA